MSLLFVYILTLLLAVSSSAQTVTVWFGAQGVFSALDSVQVDYPALDTQFVIGGNDTIDFVSEMTGAIKPALNNGTMLTQGRISLGTQNRTLNVQVTYSGKISVRIADVGGRIVLKKLFVCAADEKVNVTLDGLPASFYGIEVVAAHQTIRTGLVLTDQYAGLSHTGDMASYHEPVHVLARQAALSGVPQRHLLLYTPSDTIFYNGWSNGRMVRVSTVIEQSGVVVFDFQPTLGDRYGGGIVAALFRDGDIGYIRNEVHGIIVDTISLGSVEWGCSLMVIGTTSLNVGSGAANTEAIVAKCKTTQSAANLCNNLVRNGFSDWFLPSLYELERLYANRQWNEMAEEGQFWWSSSEILGYDNSGKWAWMKNFLTGQNISEHKQRYKLGVRAIRYF